MKGRQEGPQERRRQGRAAQGYNPDRRYQDRRDDCQRGRAAPGPHRPVAIRLTGIAAGIGRPMATPRPRSRLARYGHYPLVESTQGISAAKRTSVRAGPMAAMRTLRTLGLAHAADAERPCSRSTTYAAPQQVSRFRPFSRACFARIQSDHSLHGGRTGKERTLPTIIEQLIARNFETKKETRRANELSNLLLRP